MVLVVDALVSTVEDHRTRRAQILEW